MSYLHLTRTRTQQRTPDYDTHYTRPLVRRDSKRQRKTTLSDNDDDDDGADDYPYSSAHRPSRALTLRTQPSQLERYNIWSDRRETHDEAEHDRRYERSLASRRTAPRAHQHSLSDDDEERDFQLKVQATLSRRPRSSSHGHHHHHHHHRHHHHDSDAHFWPSDLFRHREKWVAEDWETRERSTSRETRRRDSFWGDEERSKDEEEEKWSWYRQVKKTKTKTEDEYRPLSGWRRERIVYGS